jgi:hypothetical protein
MLMWIVEDPSIGKVTNFVGFGLNRVPVYRVMVWEGGMFGLVEFCQVIR